MTHGSPAVRRAHSSGGALRSLAAAVAAMAAVAACGDDGEDAPSLAPLTRLDPATAVGFREDLRVRYVPVGQTAERELRLDVWYPAVSGTGREGPYQITFLTVNDGVKRFDATPAGAPGSLPVAVYTHGSGGHGLLAYPYAELLASHGVLVVGVTHTGNTVLDAAPPFARNLVQRPQDLRAVVDALAAGLASDAVLAGLPSDRIVLFGHSWGTQAALLLAGAQMDVDALRAEAVRRDAATPGAGGAALLDDPAVAAALAEGFRDDRVDAFVVQSPGFVELLEPASLAAIDAPVMVQSANLDAFFPYDTQVMPLWRGLDGTDDVRVEMEAGGHYTFTLLCTVLPPSVLATLSLAEEQGCSPALLPQATAVPLMAAYLEAFARATIDGDGEAAAALRAPAPAPGVSAYFR